MERTFVQVDVFGATPYAGNPVAVVLDAAGLGDEEMQRIARWTNLSETTFVLPATRGDADYGVRIFTPAGELPFAGHPTLGTAHAWLDRSHTSAGDSLVQECPAGLVRVRRIAGRLAFAAPPLVRYEPADEEAAQRVARLLGVDRGDIRYAQWVDNGPGWVAAVLGSADHVLSLSPRIDGDVSVGVAGPYPDGSEAAFEVRAFFSSQGVTFEDPVTGSLNASLAHWFFDTGLVDGPYVASQGTAIGRQGRVYVERDGDGTVWVGGATISCVEGLLHA